MFNVPLRSDGPMDCRLRGRALLRHPIYNKGSAHPAAERVAFGLQGLLPASEQTLEQQVARAYEQYSTRADALAKNTFLTSLRDQNQVLFFRLAQDHLREMMAVLYTPTEGDAIQNYSRLFRRPDGCFLRIDDVAGIPAALAHWGGADDVDYIVVTDGEEILGIGDQGVGGILISHAKLALTTLCAGIHPHRTLAVVLDCGTDNAGLRDDPLYLGLRHARVRDAPYDAFVDAFVSAARSRFPRAYLHFEDFGLGNARRLLDTYRPQLACFNDDVQGTGCVTLAAVLAGLRVAGGRLADLCMVVFGAGTAGVGIADQVRDAIADEARITKDEAARQIWLVDRPGLLVHGMALSAAQAPYAKPADTHGGLRDVVERVHPNVLVGTSTQPGAFTRDIVQTMARHVARPIILPLSNPTRLHEAVPADLLAWTDGRALIATGSPFDPVTGPWGADGAQITVEIAECNNSVVFPGIGLGAVLSRARRVTDGMLVAAVKAVARTSPLVQDRDNADTADTADGGPTGPTGPTPPLLPGVGVVRSVSVQIAKAVIQQAVAEDVATQPDIPGDDDLEAWVSAQMWRPEYRPLRPVSPTRVVSRDT